LHNDYSDSESAAPKKKIKESRKWDLGGTTKDAAVLDMSDTKHQNVEQVNITQSEVLWHAVKKRI